MAVLILVACAKGDRTVDSAAGGAAQASAAQVQAPRPAAGPADLAKSLDQYTGDEFYSLVRGLRYVGGNERERQCRGCTGPDANVRTRVRVDGVEGVDSVTAGNVPQFGVVVARALNRGNRQEDRYGLRPGTRFEYYLVVLPPTTAGTQARWRVEELEISGSQYTRRQLAVGAVVECNHPFQRGARSDFRTCDTESGARPASLGAFIQGGPGGDPWWYACGTGCCVAERGGDS